MSDDRQAAVSQAFVALVRAMADGVETVELLSGLIEDVTRLLSIASAGLLLADQDGALHVLASSSEQARQLEIHQLQAAEGPCRDCYLSGEPVVVPDLRDQHERWPRFAPTALALGFASVHAVPLRWREQRLGALGLFNDRVGRLSDDDLLLGRALADVASIAVVQDQQAVDAKTVNTQLQAALSSRVVLEQAKGVLAQSGMLDMAEAFMVLRQYSRDRNMRLSVVAAGVVSRTLPARTVLDHARDKQGRRS